MESATPLRYKTISLRDAKTIWACASSGRMTYEQIAQIVGRTKKGVQNFIWRINNNCHSQFTAAMLSDPMPQAQAQLTTTPNTELLASPPQPEVSATAVIAKLERKAEDARLEYVRLNTLVRELRAELKL